MAALHLPLTDCHAHLCDERLADDLEDVLARAEQAGIRKIVSVSETLNDARRNLRLVDRYAMVEAAAGLYPQFAEELRAREMVEFIRSNHSRLVAVGEVGLDFWLARTEEQKDLQRLVFSLFIDLAIELDLPLNVHSRSAGHHAISMLLDRGATRVQMHAFDGKASAATAALTAGFFFSIPPSVVRSRQKQKLVKNLPLDALLLETDSPVLGPDPQKRNEPVNLLLAAKTIAELKKTSLDSVLEACWRNTVKLYGKRFE
jgi:TatD DNase family protein